MANEELWRRLVGLDGHETARRAKCIYVEDPPSYTLTLLNKEYAVEPGERSIVCRGDSSRPDYARRLCILAYLINAKDLPVVGKLAPAELLRQGEFFFRGPHELGTDKLVGAFGEAPQRLYAAGEKFGATKAEYGDAAVRFYVLPRVPLHVVLWRADEEFEARASVLFDETAAEQLPLDALWMAVVVTIKELVKGSRKAAGP